jgi:hypothetical protein
MSNCNSPVFQIGSVRSGSSHINPLLYLRIISASLKAKTKSYSSNPSSSVILVTQEAEIWRIVVWSQPWANSLQDPILRKPITKKGWLCGSRCRPWVQIPVPQTNKDWIQLTGKIRLCHNVLICILLSLIWFMCSLWMTGSILLALILIFYVPINSKRHGRIFLC